MGKIYYIMGKSSSGKDSVFKEIQKRMPELSQITMYTTRPIREGERDGVEYYFTDETGLKKAGRGGACDRTACVQYKVRRVEIFYSE